MDLVRKLFGLLGLFFITISSYIIVQKIIGYKSLTDYILQLILLLSGCAIIYFSLYYKQYKNKGNAQLVNCVKWVVTYGFSIVLGNYIAIRLFITNPLYTILFIALITSIIAHIVHTHSQSKYRFKAKWFLFFFLLYAIILRLVDLILIQELSISLNLVPYIISSFLITTFVLIINHIGIKGNSVGWINTIFLLLLFVLSIELVPFANNYYNLQNTNDLSNLNEQRVKCPSPIQKETSIIKSEQSLKSNIDVVLTNFIDESIWRVENNPRGCYQGRYVNQNPNWFYCDDMIVSRWETNNLGLIRYRWYTAVSSEWRPVDNSSYIFEGFSCESGQRVTVRKETTSYYVHVSRDGTEIRIEY